MTDYNVTLSSQDKFSVNVNYETPLKQVQYTNLILDDISSYFNGVLTSFSLTVDGENYYPINEQQLLLSIDGVVLTPGVDYQISGNILNFLIPPNSLQQFSGVALVTTADVTRTIMFLIDNGSNTITPGKQGSITIDTNGMIESWTILSEETGNIAIDIKKTSYLDYPNNFSSIVGTNFPQLINQNKGKSDNLDTWDKYLNVNDILEFEVLSAFGIKSCTISLKLKL